MDISDVLTAEEVALVRRTLDHFLADPDYAEGDETGVSFGLLAFGSPLPMEIVLRDWRIDQADGSGGREVRQGDCYVIYTKLYESDLVQPDDRKNFIM